MRQANSSNRFASSREIVRREPATRRFRGSQSRDEKVSYGHGTSRSGRRIHPKGPLVLTVNTIENVVWCWPLTSLGPESESRFLIEPNYLPAVLTKDTYVLLLFVNALDARHFGDATHRGTLQDPILVARIRSTFSRFVDDMISPR